MIPKKVQKKILNRTKATKLNLEDWFYIRVKKIPYLPPHFLRSRVHGNTDVNAFLEIGKNIAQNLEDALFDHYRRDIDSFKNVLDFGCGCSRVLRWFDKSVKSCKFYGTDIDPEAIRWNKANIPFVRFETNSELPPLPFASETFDLIYCISVFTHIDENYQFQWLNELKRIAQPRAILLLSTHGRFAQEASRLAPESMKHIEEKGFLFIKGNYWKGIFPEFYQVAYHSRSYVLREWSRYFRLVDYIEKGINNHHDLVILEKRD